MCHGDCPEPAPEGVPFAVYRPSWLAYCHRDQHNLAMLLNAVVGASLGVLYILPGSHKSLSTIPYKISYTEKIMWQDTVIALGQLAFLPAMVPTLLAKDKPALTTSLMNAILVSIITICFVSLRLWFSVVTALGLVMMWGALAVQKWRQAYRTK